MPKASFAALPAAAMDTDNSVESVLATQPPDDDLQANGSTCPGRAEAEDPPGAADEANKRLRAIDSGGPAAAPSGAQRVEDDRPTGAN